MDVLQWVTWVRASKGHSSSCPVSLIISLRDYGMFGLVGPVVDNSYSHGELGGFLAQP